MTRRAGDIDPPATSVSQADFEKLYAAKADPWDLATKWYDQRKYAITMACLPHERYRKCYEPGCAIGELTRRLAQRCDELLAVDFVESAVAQARDAVRDQPHVRVEQVTLPAGLPDETFDLIVVSELLYYMSYADMTAVVDGLIKRLEPDGDLVVVHFRDDRRPREYDGFNVHPVLVNRPELISLVHHEDEAFVLDVLRRRRRWWSPATLLGSIGRPRSTCESSGET